MSGPGEETPLKAIVFGDFCGGKPVPFMSTEKAHDLALHASSILKWQLHVLSRTGVADAVILSSRPTGKDIPDSLGSMKIGRLHNPSWRSQGDALRDIESRVSLRPANDFLLVHPGALFNLNASDLVRAHAARAALDRNWLVTFVFRRGASSSPLTVATARSGALCMYASGERTSLPVELDTRAENVGLLGGGEVSMSSNVVDIGVDVCSPDLLVEFKENFDFDHVRDYVRAKLDGGEAELLGNRMFAHFVDSESGEYGTNIDSFPAYLAATQDVFDGWMTPFTPQKVTSIGSSSHERNMLRNVGDGVLVPCGMNVLKDFEWSGGTDETEKVLDVVIGANVTIEPGVTLSSCVIGDGSVVQCGSVVVNSVLGSGTRIESDCRVFDCLLLDDVTVSESVVLPERCLLDDGVVVASGGGKAAGLSPFSCVFSEGPKKRWHTVHGSNISESSESDDEESDSSVVAEGRHPSAENHSNGMETFPGMLGAGGVGFVHAGVEMRGLGSRRRAVDGYLGLNWPEYMGDVASDEEDELEGRAGPEQSITDDEQDASDRGDLMTQKFFDEVYETMEQFCASVQEIDNDTVALEINSLKLAYERSYSDARCAVIRGVVQLVQARSPSGVSYADVVSMFGRWDELVKKFSVNDSAAAQSSLVARLSDQLEEDPKVLACVLKLLFDNDLVDEDAILEWTSVEREACTRGEGRPQLLNQSDLKRFVEWLEDEDDDDDDDDDDV